MLPKAAWKGRFEGAGWEAERKADTGEKGKGLECVR